MSAFISFSQAAHAAPPGPAAGNDDRIPVTRGIRIATRSHSKCVICGRQAYKRMPKEARGELFVKEGVIVEIGREFLVRV